jgi:integration host factor subunit beta
VINADRGDTRAALGHSATMSRHRASRRTLRKLVFPGILLYTCAEPLRFEKVIDNPKAGILLPARDRGTGSSVGHDPGLAIPAPNGANRLMTKADLIEEVSRLAELTRKDSEVIVETIFDSIVRSLRVGDKIEIRGFGSFRTRQRKPRVGRNPKTGDRVEVPAKKIPFFKPSKELKDLVNTGAHGAAAPPVAPPAAPAV